MMYKVDNLRTAFFHICSYILNNSKNLTIRISTASKFYLKVHNPCAAFFDNTFFDNKTNNWRLTIT